MSEVLENKKEKVIYGSFLEDRIVTVKPVESNGKWKNLLVKGQDMKKEALMYNKTKRSYQVPLRPLREGGGVPAILDDVKRVLIQKYVTKFPEGMTQREFFEKELGVNLGHNNPPETNFWRIEKNGRVMIGKEGLTLNLNRSLDMIKYLVLLSDKSRICPNYEERELKATYEFVLVDESTVTSKRVADATVKAKAFVKFAEVTSSITKAKGFLKSLGRTIPANHTEDWINAEVLTVLENSAEKFLEIVEHPQYNARIFVQEAIEAGAVNKMGDKRYTLDNGVELGDLTDVIAYLSNVENQEVKARIKAKIELANRK
jgi:hypothetical protein